MPNTSDVKRPTDVSAQVMDLKAGVSRMEDLVGKLESHIGSVLRRAGGPIPETAEDKPIAEVCGLAGELREEVSRLRKTENALADILTRLEL